MVHGQGLTEQEDRWRAIADELAGAIKDALRGNYAAVARIDQPRRLEAALRRYEEASAE